MRSLFIIVFVIAILALMFAGCEREMPASELPPRTIKGPLWFSYTVKRETNNLESPVEVKAQEIQLFQEYVILTEKNGYTHLLPVCNIKEMNWRKE